MSVYSTYAHISRWVHKMSQWIILQKEKKAIGTGSSIWYGFCEDNEKHTVHVYITSDLSDLCLIWSEWLDQRQIQEFLMRGGAQSTNT